MDILFLLPYHISQSSFIYLTWWSWRRKNYKINKAFLLYSWDLKKFRDLSYNKILFTREKSFVSFLRLIETLHIGVEVYQDFQSTCLSLMLWKEWKSGPEFISFKRAAPFYERMQLLKCHRKKCIEFHDFSIFEKLKRSRIKLNTSPSQVHTARKTPNLN